MTSNIESLTDKFCISSIISFSRALGPRRIRPFSTATERMPCGW